jgi:uncharacterized repeat protein (TIGR01451 family)
MKTRFNSPFLVPALIAGLGLTLTCDYAAGASGVADLSLTASVSGTPPSKKGSSESNLIYSNLIYSITVSNAGPSAATGAVVSNQIPTNAIYTNGVSGEPFSIDVTFISATGGATPTNGVLLVNLGSLAVGATDSIQITVQVTNNGEPLGTFLVTNVFQVLADQTDPDLTNNSATVVAGADTTTYTTSTAEYNTTNTTTVNQQVDEYSTELIAKMPGGTVLFDQTFSAAYSNPAVQAAVARAAEDLTRAGAASYTGPAETSFLQTLVNSSSVTVPNSTNARISTTTTEYIGPQTLVVGNFGVVQGYTPFLTNWNGNPTYVSILTGGVDFDTFVFSLVDIYQTTTNTDTYLNKSVYEMMGTVGQADLSLSASAVPEPVTVGSNLLYTISVTNQGPSAASGVVVSNQIPANVTFISATGGATPTNGVLLVDLGSLAVGATNSIQIIEQPTAAGKITNFFQVFASQTDPVPTNDFATVVSTVAYAAPPPNLTIAHPGNSAVVSWPNTGSYTLQQNSNLAAANWTTSGYSITTANGTNRITITPPLGNLYFRLEQ